MKHYFLFFIAILLYSPIYSATLAVSGSIKYQKIVYTRPDTLLDESIIDQNLSGARVVAYEGATELARAETNLTGGYSISFTYTSSYVLKVESQNNSIQIGSTSSGSSVGGIYSATIASSTTESGSVVKDYTITIANKSGAFNIFQQCERGRLFFANFEISLNTVKCQWPATLTAFDPALGMLYFLSSATNSKGDPDEFDDDVILHEFGHYVAENISLDNSEGGFHSITNNVDMRLAWSEGLATWISCAIRNDPIYIDSVGGTSQNRTISSNYNNAFPSSQSKESTNEVAVTYVLWNALQLDSNVGNILTTLQKFKNLSNEGLAGERISLDTFYDLYTSQNLSSYYTNRSIEYQKDVLDGHTATNPFLISTPKPYSLSGLTFFPNGDADYLEFTATAGVSYTIQTENANNGALTSLRVYKKSNPSSSQSNSQVRNAITDDVSGLIVNATDNSTYIIEVKRFNNTTVGIGPYAGSYASTVGRYGGYSLKISDDALPTPSSNPLPSTTTSSSSSSGGGCFLNL